MLLNYLYTHFFEERQFADVAGTGVDAIASLIETRVFPNPSYTYTCVSHCASFVAEIHETRAYRFHLRGHTNWYHDITRFGLTSEARARDHFFNRYEGAKHLFLSSDLGRALQAEVPGVVETFDGDHADATWQHFLNGVYGVCTRDGRPESVFLKQAGVMFIDHMIANGIDPLSDSRRSLLQDAVVALDTVASDFAPHEAPTASRQRCIVDVRTRLADSITA